MTLDWRSPTRPKPHQWRFKCWRRALIDGQPHKSALVEVPLGGGKTLIAIEEMLELIHGHRPNAQILVLCRHANMRTVWGEQLPEHAPGLVYFILDMPRRDRLKLLEDDTSSEWRPVVWVHSHEDLPGFGNELAKYQWDMVVIDECAGFRTAGAARTKLLTRPNKTNVLRLDGDVRLAMSGMPMIKHALDLYPILRWLGAWQGDKAEFCDRFLVLDARGQELVVKDQAGLLALLDTVRFQVPRSEVIDIPRTWRYDRLPMPKWQREDYRRVQRELRTRWKGPDGLVEVDIRSRLSELLRLHQVTAGFEAVDSERWEWHDDNAKTRWLLDVVMPELEDERIIIWGQFIPEVDNLTRMLTKAGYNAVSFHGGQSPAVNQERYERWKKKGSDVQCFVSTLAKGYAGLNLPEASATVYHSRTFNTEHVAQSLERNARITTEHEQLRVIVMECETSIDQHVSKIVGDDFRRAASLTSLDLNAVLGE